MADKTAIQWADATWNPTTGCDRVSPGCANCYAMTFAPRLQKMALAKGTHVGPSDPYMRDGDPRTSGPGFGLQVHPGRLDQPLRWTRPRRIFVNSMSDLFHPEVPNSFLDQVFAVMALAHQHEFLVLTKRPERMRAYVNDPTREDRVWAALMQTPERDRVPGYTDRWQWPLPNVWLGTSVENARWRTRIDDLRACRAAVRFLSCEPLLGPLAGILVKRAHIVGDAAVWTNEDGSTGASVAMVADEVEQRLNLTGIDWVIVGGESGDGARPMDEQWVRDIVATCRRQLVAPFVKQLGEVWSRANLGHGGHAGDMDEWPADLRIREFPR